ncbi:MAG: aldehyde ferredoxin oxidoreductase family protein [Synergistaceae bacterium]|nr:aldehyde ferredoxin oxidoreductase family protein [Synergistaceae bacterium]
MRQALRVWVDLSTRTARGETLSEKETRTWGGERGLALPVLQKRLNRETDPLSPGNTLVIAAGLLNGLAFSGTCRYGVYARSPLTGALGESEAGGSFGPAMRAQGVDAIVLEAASEKPVYLWVENGSVTVHDASDLWGKTNRETFETLAARHGRISALLVGPAGERCVRYACVINDLRHANGRTGMGAVFGSKRVKAVAAPAPKAIPPVVPERLKEAQSLFAGWKENPLAWTLRETGTIAALGGLNALGILPTRNFREGTFEGAGSLNGAAYNRELLAGTHGCFACAIRCKRVPKPGARNLDPAYGGPEYETVGAFGPACGCSDLSATARAHERCNALGLDTISTGMTIAWLMEAVERRLVSPEKAGVRGFGDTEGMLALIEAIASRQGIGDVLAEGSKRASSILGFGEDFLVEVKGQELPMHDPRGKVGVALGYALAPGGADHMQMAHDTLLADPEAFGTKSVAPLGILGPMDPLSFDSEKISALVTLWTFWTFQNHLGGCHFVFAPRSAFPVEGIPLLVEAATGWKTSLWELMRMGQRSLAAARILNGKLGFGPSDDVLPKRLFEPVAGGPYQGRRTLAPETFGEAVRLAWEMLGWDEQGNPRPGTKAALGL